MKSSSLTVSVNSPRAKDSPLNRKAKCHLKGSMNPNKSGKSPKPPAHNRHYVRSVRCRSGEHKCRYVRVRSRFEMMQRSLLCILGLLRFSFGGT